MEPQLSNISFCANFSEWKMFEDPILLGAANVRHCLFHRPQTVYSWIWHIPTVVPISGIKNHWTVCQSWNDIQTCARWWNFHSRIEFLGICAPTVQWGRNSWNNSHVNLTTLQEKQLVRSKHTNATNVRHNQTQPVLKKGNTFWFNLLRTFCLTEIWKNLSSRFRVWCVLALSLRIGTFSHQPCAQCALVNGKILLGSFSSTQCIW